MSSKKKKKQTTLKPKVLLEKESEVKKEVDVVYKVHKARKLHHNQKSDPALNEVVIPKVVPVKPSSQKSSAISKVTKHKFIAGQWWYLKRGEQIVAPQVVIESLRNAKFVE